MPSVWQCVRADHDTGNLQISGDGQEARRCGAEQLHEEVRDGRSGGLRCFSRRQEAERRRFPILRHYRPPLPGRQLGLILAARITLAHFSVSAARKRPNSAGVIGIGTPPRSMMRALSFGSARAVVTPVLSLSTISRGTPAGAPRPAKALVSKPGRNSAIGGTPGSSSSDVGVDTASARRRPALM